MVERDEKALISEVVRRMNESSIRIKDLDSRTSRIERDFALISESTTKKFEEFKSQFKEISKKISEISENLTGISNEVIKVRKELENAATKTEVKELGKFIELITPMTTRFVTRSELESILEEKLKKV